MPEERVKFNIEKQEAGRDLFNVAGNLIINPITHEPVYIPSIQSVLRKGETTEGDFFKKEPEWVDYEQGFIVERKEVDEIIKKLENNKVQLVLGAPASGKSIILKNVGFKLASKNNVYVVELKKHPEDEIKLFFETIPKIDDDNPIFIIDDAHFNISKCERLIRNFKGRGKGKLIIGSRERREITDGNPTESSEFEHLNKTAINIQAEDVTEGMIQTFLKKQYNLDEDKIRTASIKLDDFKKDLWYLSWALKVYDSDNYSVDENKISKNIKKRIENINAENVFLPLSTFFRYEIPIERKFLEKQMGIEDSIIEDLIGLQEIVEIEETGKHKLLSLNHSSIADLYFKTYKKYPDLGEEIKDKILNQADEKYLEYLLFYRYLTNTDPRNSISIVISLQGDSSDEKGGLTLLRKLVEQEEIKKSIVIGINNEEDIGKVGRCLLSIANTNKEIASKLADNIDIIGFKTKMLVTDASGNALGLAGISIASKEAGMKLVYNVVAKVDAEEDIENINWSMLNIAHADVEVAFEFVDKIDKDILSSKINKEEDIEKVGSCVSYIAATNKEVALKLANSIDFNALASKINKEEDIGKVGWCVSLLAEASKEVALKLVKSIDINALASKINKEGDIRIVGFCVAVIGRASKEVAIKLANSIDINALASKINKEDDIEKVGSCASWIARASKEVALKLVENLSSKIDKEADLGKIGSCMSEIARASQEVALRLVDSVSARIDKEEDIGKVGDCVSGIAQENREVANEIANRLNQKLSDELQKRLPYLKIQAS